MEIILQKELPHQQKAVDSVCGVFAGVKKMLPAMFYENPQFDLSDEKIKLNINKIQALNHITEHEILTSIDDCLKLDVKMETGTGKTYVYTKTIYELHKKYKINKFVIVVPTLPIKAGATQFLQDAYSRRHFTDACGYGTEIELGVLEAPKTKKKGRSYFPSEVSDFIKGSYQNSRKIYVLLLNMQLLTNAKVLTRDDYDYGAEGFYRPIDAISATRPFVIIDEPHRFSKENQAFNIIEKELKPQCIIRYGATFPEKIIGKGKNKITRKDYQNLLYDLNACQAFNQGLVKGVAKEHFEPISAREEMVKVTSIDRFDTVHFQLIKREPNHKIIQVHYALKAGDPLSIVSEAFQNIVVKAVGEHIVEFSNGFVKRVGEEWDVDVFMTSYQEQMLKLALQRHFEVERINFCNRQFKIKTLALFFIDDISSYRDTKTGEPKYLLTAFERLLRERIESTLASLTAREKEYCEYLKASLANISACHAGYFSQDNDDADEKIAEEVNTILHDKKKLLSFKSEDGSYYPLRFLFSKWTLKEGWDNPNVFTIAKLRSSGSDISRLQEVGRGLRLPVDECGNRISNEEFMLNYIVDFRDRDFAEQLVADINAEVPQSLAISDAQLESVAKQLGVSADDLFFDLFQKHYIDRNKNIKPENRNAFFNEYPGFESGLLGSKVRDRNNDKLKQIKIRRELYTKELKTLWETINKRYLLFFDSELNDELDKQVLSLFENYEVFVEHDDVYSKREIVRGFGGSVHVENATGVQYAIEANLNYNDFLKRISNATSLPIAIIHSALCEYVKKHGMVEAKNFNENTVAAFCKAFSDWKNRGLSERFSYRATNAPLGATALTYADGTPQAEISQERVGRKFVEGTPGEKYLYDAFAYDSPLEKNNIMAEIDGVVVYGKIPKRSIAIPTITGGTYSPDFMYVVNRKDGVKVLNLVIETKDVEDESDLREKEKINIDCAKIFFKALERDGYNVSFKRQLKNEQMIQIIREMRAVNSHTD